MALKIPSGGLVQVLSRLVADWNGGYPLTIHLFQNDYTPVDASVLADFTEADFNGYASDTVTTWADPSTVSIRARTTATALNWTKSAGGTGNSIYGYYILDNGGNLAWAERDPSAPINMTTDGNEYNITPAFTLRSEF